eukprot:scaffold391_cov223-Pinguiococcus_pyrenoidosus.AAC.2
MAAACVAKPDAKLENVMRLCAALTISPSAAAPSSGAAAAALSAEEHAENGRGEPEVRNLLSSFSRVKLQTCGKDGGNALGRRGNSGKTPKGFRAKELRGESEESLCCAFERVAPIRSGAKVLHALSDRKQEGRKHTCGEPERFGSHCGVVSGVFKVPSYERLFRLSSAAAL